jgi:hypothetical protein
MEKPLPTWRYTQSIKGITLYGPWSIEDLNRFKKRLKMSYPYYRKSITAQTIYKIENANEVYCARCEALNNEWQDIEIQKHVGLFASQIIENLKDDMYYADATFSEFNTLLATTESKVKEFVKNHLPKY